LIVSIRHAASKRSVFGKSGAKLLDHGLAGGNVGLLCVENPQEALLL
jgi:hypothetical protein